jgi:hypothetical protein
VLGVGAGSSSSSGDTAATTQSVLDLGDVYLSDKVCACSSCLREYAL